MMNTRSLAIFGAITALLLLLIKALRIPSSGTKDASPAPAPKPVVSVVEQTLHQHEGEESPFVQAFEHALQEEARHEADVAH